MTAQSNSYDPLMTMAALNMAVVSLHRITSSGDRLILDREYTNIINNIRMGEINADPALTGLYQEIVRVIHGGRLRDDLRGELSVKHSSRQKKSIGEIIYGNALKSFKLNPLQWLGKLAASSVSEYFESLREEGRQEQSIHYDNMKLKHDELDEYSELQRKLLGSSWSLLRQYNIPDNYRLTQDGLGKFSAAMNEPNPSKRQRMLKYLEGEFSVYAPYWFHRAVSSRESVNNDEAGKCFARFSDVWRPVLRKDPYMAESMKHKIEGLMRGGNNAEEIKKCLEVMRRNSQLDDWANNIYMAMIYFTLGEKEKAEERVMCNIDFGFETETSGMLLAFFENTEIPAGTESNPVNIPETVKKESGKSLFGSFMSWLKPEQAPENFPSKTKPVPEILPVTPEHVPEKLPVSPEPVQPMKESESLSEEDMLILAAKNGDSEAQYKLGMKYFAESKDYALFWLEKAGNAGNISAQLQLCNIYYSRNEKHKAFKWLEKAAEQGSAEAQYRLAVRYLKSGNKGKATLWCRKSADQNYYDAQKMMGDIYRDIGDKNLAEHYYRKARENPEHEPEAEIISAQPEPEKLSRKIIRERARHGDPDAKYQIARSYDNIFLNVITSKCFCLLVFVSSLAFTAYAYSFMGMLKLILLLVSCVAGNIALYKISESFRKHVLALYTQSAENGITESQFRLGLMNERIARDVRICSFLLYPAIFIMIALWIAGFFYLSWGAWFWCFVVGTAGFFSSCILLEGSDIISKPDKKWYLEAGNNGHAEAQYRLGIMYDKEGKFDKAHKWFTKAASNGHSKAESKLRTFGKGYGKNNG